MYISTILNITHESKCLGQSSAPWPGSSLIDLPSHQGSSSQGNHRSVILHLRRTGSACGCWRSHGLNTTITAYVLGVRGGRGKFPFLEKEPLRLLGKQNKIISRKDFSGHFFFIPLSSFKSASMTCKQRNFYEFTRIALLGRK